jgi:hypothetical protein
MSSPSRLQTPRTGPVTSHDEFVVRSQADLHAEHADAERVGGVGDSTRGGGHWHGV